MGVGDGASGFDAVVETYLVFKLCEATACDSGSVRGRAMISTRLRFAVVWGRVSVMCRALWILGDFC